MTIWLGCAIWQSSVPIKAGGPLMSSEAAWRHLYQAWVKSTEDFLPLSTHSGGQPMPFSSGHPAGAIPPRLRSRWPWLEVGAPGEEPKACLPPKPGGLPLDEEPHKCPVCDGRGKRPIGPRYRNMVYSGAELPSANPHYHECNACKGTGIV